MPKGKDGHSYQIEVTKQGSMYFEVGWHKIKILKCPFCGKGGKQIIKEY